MAAGRFVRHDYFSRLRLVVSEVSTPWVPWRQVVS
jgi:hypothetical protein